VFDRGDRLNRLSIQAMRELKRAAEILREDADISAITLSAPNAFSAGADLTDPEMAAREKMSAVEQRTALRLGPEMCEAWANLEQITITAIEGFCIGGGLALATACDHRVMAKGAHMRLPEVPLGMNMSWRSVPRLVALIGPSRAKELIVLGRKVEAEEALQWGLIDRREPGEALQTARDLAQEYAALPPLAARMAKEAIEASAHALAFATSHMDRDQFMLARASDDHAEALAAFLEKRSPEFRA
ncbi:MAG: enoyl-CoA hydratase/isomerase family protein, partial [Erythrobacter sp.]|nr:enoyl-CoA hydratase/isomerase family protein [Erythrobacter sp.]